MGKPEQEFWRSIASSAGLVGQLGITVATPIVIGAVAGVHLDRWLGTHGIATAAALILGLLLGGLGAYRMLAFVLRDK